MLSPGFVRANHPELGPVVYTPGELLPAWLMAALAGDAELVVTDEPGVLELQVPGRDSKPAAVRTPKGGST